ncbi:MAG: PEP/pyruvate-binding domain-containing protein, partial [Candidatus Thorarchaeota archaeon]
MSQVRKRYIIELSNIGKKNQVGNKAKNLAYLLKKDYTIPKTMVCVFDAYLGYQSGNTSVLSQIEEELSSLIEKDKKYSVRSSANIEDATSYSFAGQFATHLNVRGVKAIVEAIVAVWESAVKVSETDYVKTIKNDDDVLMGVIIQEMVQPDYSGVVFTKNPMTGLDEVIVESVDGYGDALVQEGVTPDRWVYKWGDWLEEPESHDERRSVIETLIQQSQDLAKTYGAPLDLEWCFDGQQVYWLQLRAITALESTKLFSNRLSREFLPGMIKPLVWSINIPMINSSWKSLFKEVIGKTADSIDISTLS